MAILKTDAVVLKGWKMGETSKILSLYTKDFGKVKVVAKGGRNPKSPFRGCLEPLTTIRIIYYDKRTRDLQLLSKADLIDPHSRIIGDMERTTLGLAAAELVDRAVTGEESLPQVYDLLTSVLRGFNEQEDFLEAILWYFESHFMHLMGYKPKWDHCLDCNQSLGKEGGFFQPQSGGLVCSQCGVQKGGLVVEGETLEILFWLQRCGLEEVVQLKPSPSQKSEIRKMFDLYFKSHIDHMQSLRSLGFYYQLTDHPSS
ncbi:DNA repair protein RecO [bacterium]|nr:DNA repair protein RecO [bacterium]